jgi:lysophospholipid acyltransferase (LPLAT)-like uncharacterized protein
MKKLILSRLHVNEVPIHIKPLFYLYGYGIAILGWIYCCIVHLTSKIKISGKEYINENVPYILCFWHQFIFLYFVIFLRNRRHIWMQHPIWYMKPAHIFLRFIGVNKIILGSTGHAGKEAADSLIPYLRNGYSTAIMPDGPNGPPFIMKKGVLHISLQSNVPIVPMRFKASHSWEIHHWDRRLWPLPFSTFTVEFGEAIQVTNENYEKVYDLIAERLG